MDTLDPSNSMLFLGAGFSAGAKSVSKEEMPAGNPLKKKLAELLNESPDDYDLQTLAQEFTEKDGEHLHRVLYDTFTVSEPTEDQRSILSLPWRRIYTTNYDNIIEHCRPELASFDYDQPKPKSLPRQLVVHLHGSVRSATPENILSQLVLKGDTYVQQIAAPSPWLDEFAKDARFSDVCIFFGYSLADHHITARLTRSENNAKKTFFYTNKLTRIFQGRTREYGTSFEIERERFSALCQALPRPQPVSDIKTLKNFKFIDPFADRKSQAAITPPEIFGLMTLGVFRPHRYAGSFQTNTYILDRAEAIQQAQAALQTGRTLIVHSRLGNGKSIFLLTLAYHLIEAGFRCFSWRGLSAGIDAEMSLLAKSGRVVISFDDYDQAAEHISRLGSEMPEAKFIVTARSSQQSARQNEISEFFPKPTARLCIDNMSGVDIANFRTLLDRSGLLKADTRKALNDTTELRDVITGVFNNKAVTEAISKLLSPVLGDPNARFVFTAAQLGKWLGLPISNELLDRAGSMDSYAALKKYEEVSSDLFYIEDGVISARSSLLSEYLIAKTLDARDVCGACYFLTKQAVVRKQERVYRNLMGSLMQVSNLKRLTNTHANADEQVNWLFDNLARDIHINEEPLFWLQYCILMMDAKEYTRAESYLDTGYDRAKKSPKFETYQLDTQAVRVFLEIEASLPSGQAVSRADKIFDSLTKLLPMLGSDNHRFFAVDVLRHVKSFVNSRSRDLTNSERNAFVYHLNLLSQALSGLDQSMRVQTGSDLIKTSLEHSISFILHAAD